LEITKEKSITKTLEKGKLMKSIKREIMSNRWAYRTSTGEGLGEPLGEKTPNRETVRTKREKRLGNGSLSKKKKESHPIGGRKSQVLPCLVLKVDSLTKGGKKGGTKDLIKEGQQENKRQKKKNCK